MAVRIINFGHPVFNLQNIFVYNCIVRSVQRRSGSGTRTTPAARHLFSELAVCASAGSRRAGDRVRLCANIKLSLSYQRRETREFMDCEPILSQVLPDKTLPV